MVCTGPCCQNNAILPGRGLLAILTWRNISNVQRMIRRRAQERSALLRAVDSNREPEHVELQRLRSEVDIKSQVRASLAPCNPSTRHVTATF